MSDFCGSLSFPEISRLLAQLQDGELRTARNAHIPDTDWRLAPAIVVCVST